jgi:hypothetical protein
MLFTLDIKTELNPFSANNVETQYNWLPWSDSGSGVADGWAAHRP